MSEDKKAKDYLTGNEFKVFYVYERDIVVEQDYPDYIPNKEDVIILGEETFIVVSRIYSPETNKMKVEVEKYQDHLDRINSMYKRKDNT